MLNKLFLFIVLCVGISTSQVQPDPFTGNYSIKQFGAVGNHATDDTVAIQSAFDTLCPIAGNTGITLIVPKPSGVDYRTTKPIRVKCANVSLIGSNQNGSLIRGANPLFIWGAQEPPFPLTISPDGTQTAFVMNSSKQYWLSLVDLYQSLNTPQPLNGLTALNIRFVFQINSYTQGGFTKYITSAQSGVFPHSPTASRDESVYSVAVSQNQNLTCKITTDKGTFAVTSPANSLDLMNWHTGECDWDGTTLRIRIDGVDLGSIPATGVLVQTIFQNITIGTSAKFLDTGYSVNMVDGALSSLQISSVSRVATIFPVKFVSDNNTIALFNFDDQSACSDLCTKAKTKNGSVITWLRYASITQIGGPTIDSIQFGGAVVIIGGPAAQLRNITFTASPFGLYLYNNSYVGNFTNIQISTGGTGCLAAIASANSGLNSYTNINAITQCAISHAIVGAASATMNHAFYSTTQGSQYGLVVVADQANESIVCVDCNFSTEANSTLWVAPIAISGIGSLTMLGGQAESFVGTKGFPLAYFDGINTATFTGFTARIPNNPAPSEFFHMYSPPIRPITVINFFNNLSQLPSYQFPMSNISNTVQSPVMQF